MAHVQLLDSTLTLNGFGDLVRVMTTSSRSGAPDEGGWKVNLWSRNVVKRKTSVANGRVRVKTHDSSHELAIRIFPGEVVRIEPF